MNNFRIFEPGEYQDAPAKSHWYDVGAHVLFVKFADPDAGFPVSVVT